MAVVSRVLACSVAVLSGLSQAAVRTLPDRQQVGECPSVATGDMFLAGQITGDLPSSLVQQAEAGITNADLIEIKYGSNFKVMLEKHAKEAYVLTQCGTTAPTQAEINAVMQVPSGYTVKNFVVPLQVVGSATTTNLAFFRALGIEDRVKYVSQYATGACWQQALSCGATADMTAQLSDVDAWFMDCDWQRGCVSVNEQPKGVHVSATQDPGPLRSAEHLKFIAAFFNKEALATQLFSQQVTTYTSLSASYSTQPVVAWINYDSYGKAFTLSQAFYKLKYVEHAGGRNVNGDAVQTALGSGMSKTSAASGATYTFAHSSADDMAQASAAFFGALKSLGVGVVIDEVYAPTPASYTIDSFYATYGLNASSDLRFVQDRMVLRVDGTVSEADGLAWFESRVARPDWAVEGLVRQLHSDSTKQQIYFRNVAKSEAPTVVTKGQCAAPPLMCSPATLPAPIGLMNAVSGAAAVRGIAALLLLPLLAMQHA